MGARGSVVFKALSRKVTGLRPDEAKDLLSNLHIPSSRTRSQLK
jgi:hypothetical protein